MQPTRSTTIKANNSTQSTINSQKSEIKSFQDPELIIFDKSNDPTKLGSMETLLFKAPTKYEFTFLKFVLLNLFLYHYEKTNSGLFLSGDTVYVKLKATIEKLDSNELKIGAESLTPEEILFLKNDKIEIYMKTLSDLSIKAGIEYLFQHETMEVYNFITSHIERITHLDYKEYIVTDTLIYYSVSTTRLMKDETGGDTVKSSVKHHIHYANGDEFSGKMQDIELQNNQLIFNGHGILICQNGKIFKVQFVNGEKTKEDAFIKNKKEITKEMSSNSTKSTDIII